MAAKKQTFEVVLRDDGAFEIPFDVRATYGEARPAVKMTLCGETRPTRVMVYGGKPMLGIWKAMLDKHELRAGQTLEVTLEPDTEARVVKPPKELAAALDKHASARAGWQAMSYTHQREWATAIADAKKPETRERRLAQALEALTARAKQKKSSAAKRER